MRSITKVYKYKDRRTKRWFAFLPVTANDGKYDETRWFEFVVVEQEYDPFNGWENLRFKSTTGRA